MNKFKIITLCGSTRFKDEFIKVQKQLTIQGNIVISLGLFGHSGDVEALNIKTKQMLDDMCKAKIDMADEIFVINVGGYIGESTEAEIKYAQLHHKPIKYYHTCNDCDNFSGMGDWNLCCKESHPEYTYGFLCYENTPACQKFKPIHKLSKEEFYKKHCQMCGSQRCEGIDTDWGEGCQLKRYFKKGDKNEE